MIQVDVVNVFLTAKGDEFVILLRGVSDQRTLPISIGQLEAQSIVIQLYHHSFPRPLTHDLFKSTLERLGCKVTRVVINDLIDNTFYARLVFENSGETIDVDSRPSDAIALALRFAAPVFVEEQVMEKSGIILPQEIEGETISEKERGTGAQSPVETLKSKLAKAIQEERYEDAARLRDEISKLTKSN